MHRTLTTSRATARTALGFALATLLLAVGADGTAANPDTAFTPEAALQQARVVGRRAADWFRRTPPAERMTWGGLAACAGLGLGVVLERSVRLRRRRVVPRDFVVRYLDRLQDGKLDRGKALDFCELNPSPASRVALAAVRRWGRPVVDLERAVALAQRVEVDRLRRNVGTLRRVAVLSPLLGLLGALIAAGRIEAVSGPALAASLSPLTAGVALAILALVAYDGLTGRVEALAGTLDRLGAETIDAIALATPPEPRIPELRAHVGGPLRSPHPVRVEIPDALTRPRDRD